MDAGIARWCGDHVGTVGRFDVASISKLFTSVAVLQLVAAGSLDLDASIHEYADLASTAIDPSVTLRRLLTHTSGIADIAEEDEGENYAEVFRVVPCHTIVTLRDFLPLFARKPPHFAPGSGSRYCNAGYVVAGMAVEHASGQGFREYVEAQVPARAGMTRSGYFDKRYAIPDLAEGFDPTDDGRLEQNLYAYPPEAHPTVVRSAPPATCTLSSQRFASGSCCPPTSPTTSSHPRSPAPTASPPARGSGSNSTTWATTRKARARAPVASSPTSRSGTLTS